MDAQAAMFIKKIQRNANDLAIQIEMAIDLRAMYFDRTYGSGGAKEITVPDLVDYGITPAQLASFVTFAEQMERLRDGQAVATGDYGATLNQVRALR